MILIRYVLTWSLERTWPGKYNFSVSGMEYPFSFFPTLEPLPDFSVSSDASGVIGYGVFMDNQ